MALTAEQIADLDSMSGLSPQNMPSTLTPEQIAELDAMSGLGSQPQKPDIEAQGWIARQAKQYFPERYAAAQESANMYANNEQSYPETMARIVGQGFGAEGDVIGEGLKKAGKTVYNALPDTIKEGIPNALNRGADYIVDSRFGPQTSAAINYVGNALRNTGNYALQEYQNFSNENPRIAKDIEAAVNIGMGIAPGIPVKGQSIGRAIESVGKKTGQVAAIPAKSLIKATLPDIPLETADLLSLAQKHNIPVTLPQATGSRSLATVQKLTQPLPFSGTEGFRNKQIKAWQKELFKTVGVDADSFTPKNVDKAFTKVGKEFDILTKGKQFDLGNDFLEKIKVGADEIGSTAGQEASDIFKKEAFKVLGDIKANGKISGEALAFQRGRINKLTRKASNPELKDALGDLENILADSITSGDPQLKNALSTAKMRYKNLIALEPLAAKAKGGNISPSLLNNRISKIYGRAHVRGQSGDIGDLARIGHELLGEYGGSDTAEKLLYAGALGGATLLDPISAALAAGATLGGRGIQSGILRNQGLVKMAHEKSLKKTKGVQ